MLVLSLLFALTIHDQAMLSHDSYDAREAAEARLAFCREAAVPALLIASRQWDDLERRRRSEKLLKNVVSSWDNLAQDTVAVAFFYWPSRLPFFSNHYQDPWVHKLEDAFPQWWNNGLHDRGRLWGLIPKDYEQTSIANLIDVARVKAARAPLSSLPQPTK